MVVPDPALTNSNNKCACVELKIISPLNYSVSKQQDPIPKLYPKSSLNQLGPLIFTVRTNSISRSPEMSLQMSIVFATLVAQMSFLFVLVTPLPFAVRKQVVDFTFFLQKNKHYNMFVSFFLLLMGLQTADCVQKLQRFHKTQNPYFAENVNKPLSYDQLASKFYAQRNLYISGAVLYLTIATYTVVTIVRKLVVKEEAIRLVESGKVASPNEADDAAKLQQKLDKKEKEISALQKQVDGLQRQYNSLNTAATGDKKAD